MDAISLDEWELLPDHKSSFFLEEHCSNGGHGAVSGKDQLLLGAELVVIDMDHFAPASHPPPYDCILDEEAKKPLLQLPAQDACVHDLTTEFKDIVVVPAEPRREELVSKVTEILIYDSEEEDMIEPPAGVKEADQDEVLVAAAAPDGQCAREEEGVNKTGLSVGNLRVNGVGALCSFGVAAATFFIFLLGGKQQQQKRQDHKVQLQIPLLVLFDLQRIQQVVQQASRLNQTMSSVMGGASSPRASISFGGYYQGF
ncbi:hypothetical protein BAE44_0011318 [Dichanthelium oligosanthes]|uniref:DUF6821 domain-containing protein n=1 Tax=Dichanthelium oligosanthes TaxID=888268 RepID=A0A1E5VRA9_9POAL|nr:hypothetical protein BAE44_0011318 [Dichanthelium oligosanthes]